MDLQLSSRVAARLVVALAKPKLSPVAEAASKHEPRLRSLIVKSAKATRELVPMRELESVLIFGGSGAPLYLLEGALKAWERELLGDGVEPAPTDWIRMRAAANKNDLPSVLNAALVSGAGAAEVCVVMSDSAKVVDRYVNGGVSDTMNNSLRYERQTAELNAIARELDAAMLPLDSSMQLFRVSDLNAFPDLKVGDAFTDLGFTSTTMVEKNLSKIAKEVAIKPRDRVFFEIEVPRGTGAVDVNALIGKSHDFAKQEEVILQRGLRYEVVDVQGNRIKLRASR